MEKAIEVINLVKRYSEIEALKGISFYVNKKEIFGLLGPNGAGKTTTIKILTGLTEPTAGEAYVAGFSVVEKQKEVKKRIGWIASEIILDDELSVWENIELQAKLHGMKNWQDRGRELLKIFNLQNYANKLVGKLSTGMRKKLEIITALLHSPEVLFMDEPTIGLDVNSRMLLWSIIRQINREFEVTILLTTHYMEEADQLCNRVAIINEGKIVSIGSPSELKSRIGGDVIEVEIDNAAVNPQKLREIRGVEDVILSDGKLRVKVKRAEEVLPELVRVIDFSKVKTMKVEKPTLDTVFMMLTGKRMDESNADIRNLYMRIRRARQ